MSKYIIIGGSGHAKVVNDVAYDNNLNVIGYADIKKTDIDLPYLGNDEFIINNYKSNEVSLLMGLGIINIKSYLRSNIEKKYKNAGFQFSSLVSKYSYISKSSYVDIGSVVFVGCVLQANVRIGENSIINTKASLDHDCFVGNNTHIAPGVTLSGNVTIGNNCLIGVGSNIIQGITIGDNVIIGAGSTVVKNVEIEGTYFGNPCKFIKN